MPKDTLTVKQHAFVQAYLVNGGNASQAYKDAGYTVKSDTVARTEGRRILAKPHIDSHLTALRLRSDNATVVTLDSLTDELNDVLQRSLAADTPNLSVARQCIVDKARLHGHIVSRQHVDVSHSSVSIDQADVDEVIAQLTAKRDGQPQLSIQASATDSDTERAGA